MRAGSGSSIANSAGSISSGTPSGSRGVITRKFRTANGGHAVDLDVQAENQRGDVTTPGHATIILPSREGGAVVLPDPPGGARNLTEALGAIADAFADGSAAPLR